MEIVPQPPSLLCSTLLFAFPSLLPFSQTHFTVQTHLHGHISTLGHLPSQPPSLSVCLPHHLLHCHTVIFILFLRSHSSFFLHIFLVILFSFYFILLLIFSSAHNFFVTLCQFHLALSSFTFSQFIFFSYFSGYIIFLLHLAFYLFFRWELFFCWLFFV